LADARDVLDLCQARGILLQVNFWRRCDPFCRRLAAGELEQLIGRPAVINAFYGNGVRNNGSHVVDLCRMLFGEIASVRALGAMLRTDQANDHDVACMLHFNSGAMANLQPLHFSNYREVGLDIWGETGRLEMLNEGLTARVSRRAAHRALTAAREIEVDAPESLPSTVGEALWHVYANLAAALLQGADLLSPGTSALQTAAVVEAIERSAAAGDGRLEPPAGGGFRA
jgi:predicted dehydrogenase